MSTTDTKVMYICKDRKKLREQPCTLANQNGCCTVTACIYYEGKLQYDAMVVRDPMPLKHNDNGTLRLSKAVDRGCK